MLDINQNVQAKAQAGLFPYETGEPTEQGQLLASDYRSATPIKRLVQGWYACSVPGTILCPWDADFSTIFASQDREAIDRLAAAVHTYNQAAKVVLSLLS